MCKACCTDKPCGCKCANPRSGEMFLGCDECKHYLDLEIYGPVKISRISQELLKQIYVKQVQVAAEAFKRITDGIPTGLDSSIQEGRDYLVKLISDWVKVVEEDAKA